MNTVCNNIPMSQLKSLDNSRLREDVGDLMASVTQHGMLQPIGVKKNGKGYHVVYGNRRFAAAKKLKMASVPCVVLTEAQAKNEEVLNLVENLQRENPNVIELGRYIKRLTENGYTTGEVAAFINKPKSFVKVCLLAIDNVPPQFKKHITMSKNTAIKTGIPLSYVNTIESGYRQIGKSNKAKLYRLAKKDNMSLDKMNKICKGISAGHTFEQSTKLVNKYERLTVTVFLTKSDIKKLSKHTQKHKTLNNVILGILSGKIKETIKPL